MTARSIILLLGMLAVTPAQAGTPEEVFARVSPSVVVVAVIGENKKVTSFGSGVVIGPGRVVTNCHVARKGGNLKILYEKKIYSTQLTLADPSRDLCELSTPTLTAPAVTLAPFKDVKIGQRVYAVGAPRGLDLTLSEGLVSGLRNIRKERYIQTSAPISPGSSGGGLFDADGRLIGITTFFLDKGQNLNFALPADWIGELPARAKANRQNGNDLTDWKTRATDLERSKDWSGLLEHGREWTRREPANAEAWLALGGAHGNLKQSAPAITAFREAARLKPDDARAWHNLGVMYERAKDHDRAVTALREALRLRPNHVTTWYAIGSAYHAQGQRDKVQEAYEQIKRLDAAHAKKFFNAYILP